MLTALHTRTQTATVYKPAALCDDVQESMHSKVVYCRPLQRHMQCIFLAVRETGYWPTGHPHKMQAFAYSSLKACVLGASLAPHTRITASATVGEWVYTCVAQLFLV